MQDLDILHLANQRIGRAESKKGLSMEERVRLNLAQTLLQEKDVIFLDEPLRGLDLIGTLSLKIDKGKIIELLSKFARLSKSLQPVRGKIDFTTGSFSFLWSTPLKKFCTHLTSPFFLSEELRYLWNMIMF